MTEPALDLQDAFLTELHKTRRPVTIFLTNGVKLNGVVGGFDLFSVLLRREGHSQLVFMHAIATIVPVSPGQCATGKGRE